MLIYGTIIGLLLVGCISWRNLRWGIYLIPVLLPTYLWRLSIFGVPTTFLELTIYVITLIWLTKLLRREAVWDGQAWRSYQVPLILLGAGLLIGLTVSSYPTVSLGVIKGWFIDPLLIFGLLVSNLQKRTEVRQMILGLFISGSFLSLVAWYQVISGHFITIDQRASAFFTSANYLSLYLVPIIILSITLIDRSKWKNNWWAVLGIGSMLVAMYFTYSYAGWLALFVAGAMLIWLFTANKRWLAGVGLVLAVFIVSQWHLPKFQQMLDLVGRSSTHVRLQVWQTSLLMIKEHWSTGIGLGLFEQRYPEFANRLFHPPLELVMLHAHNLFLYFWINTGLVGLIGFLGILGMFFIQIVQAWRTRHDLIVASVGAAMLAILVHGLLDTPYWKNDLAAVFWIVVALGAILNREVHGGKNLSDRH